MEDLTSAPVATPHAYPTLTPAGAEPHLAARLKDTPTQGEPSFTAAVNGHAQAAFQRNEAVSSK
jgi:hypothetical protein